MATIEYVRPPLYEKQLHALFHDRRYGLVEASTKAGKTVGCIAWLTEQALFQGGPGKSFWWVAPVYNQTEIAYRRLKQGLTAGIASPNETNKVLTLINGAMIWFKSADKPDGLYGEDVYAAVIDEASRVKADAFHAVRSTLTATRGKLRIIGNVKGRKNWFYDLARRAEAEMHQPDSNMHYAKLIAYDAIQAGVLAPEEVEDARRVLPEEVFRELYLAEPSDDGGNPFGLGAIARCIMEGLSDGIPVCWGWDLAKQHDWTVGIALDAEGRVCRFVRFRKPWLETVQTIIEMTGGCQALIDSTGVGDPIVEALQRGNPPRYNFQGFKFTMSSKQQLMEGLAVGIQREELRFPDGSIRHELEAFEFEEARLGVRYSAPAGQHDDCVCALALAWKLYHKPEQSPWMTQALEWVPPRHLAIYAR